MGSLVRSVTRYVPTTVLAIQKPTYREYEVRLIKWDTCFTVNTPWACLSATGNETDEQLGRIGGGFSTKDEAIAEANKICRYWDANEFVRERLLNNIRWHGSIVGPCRTADEFNLSLDGIFEYARGRRPLPKGTKLHAVQLH